MFMHQPIQKHPFSTICHAFLKRTHSSQGQKASLTIGRWVISGLMLVGVTTVLLPDRVLSADPMPAPTVPLPAVKPAAPVMPIPAAQQILGQWLTKEPLDGDTVMVVFAPDGKAFIITGTSASGNAIATQFRYRLDAKPQPMRLDIVLTADAIVETLLEFTASGDLRLQMLGTRPGKPRPAALTDNATLFQKISDDTTPPPGTEVKPSP
jgi:hypothetical protein